MRLTLAILLTQFLVSASSQTKRSYTTHDYYVLEHNPSAGASLDECTHALGVEVVEQAGQLPSHWLVRTQKMDTHRTKRGGDHVLAALSNLRNDASSESRFLIRSDSASQAQRISSSIKYLARQELKQRIKRAPPPVRPGTDDDASSSRAIASRLGITDPSFPQQWHLVNDEFPQHMMNVTGLWEMGITGKGVISVLVDDGLDYTHPDLADNFWAQGSYDFNDHEPLPTPKLFDDHHGTRCAGQIGAVKNDACGVGIAYDSKIAGIRILSGPISDVDEASSLNYGFDNTSIFSCSWGPPDDGRSMEAPGYLIEKAFVHGVTNGRDGRGSIFVFASGNGASHQDQCNFDGYTNSIYSITVSAIDYTGLHPYYSEPCAANMLVAYSSGGGRHIVTTDVHEKCSSNHGGTSAAAPNAAGVFALALSARPELTWRDMQHIAVRTARKINPEDPDWEATASGRFFSYKYGYGALDGYAYVMAAQQWGLVKPQAWIHLPAVQLAGGSMTASEQMSGGDLIVPGGLTSVITITEDTLKEHNFEGLEHVTVRVWINHTRRGDVEVELTSPNGIKSILAANRPRDLSTSGFPGWRFMSVKHWEENPVGDWSIRVSDQASEKESGQFLGWTITLWGSTINPEFAKEYKVPLIENQLPPVDDHEDGDGNNQPSPTKVLTKPTAGLPSDHGSAQGEATKPAFGSSPSSAISPTSTAAMSPTLDEGWVAQMSNLMYDQKWFFAAIGVVVLFGIGVGIFFWRRAVRRRRANYTSLPADEMPLSSMREGRPTNGRTKELYDAFGEVSDDEDADEHTGLRPDLASREGLGFHSGFLDDDDPQSAGPTQYRDEPGQSRPVRARSPPDSNSSWEHASQVQ